MEDTMSSYSFSHQFYQRWTCAPEPVRAAITQELKDITTLLQSDTSFEDFTFNTHDLDAYVDELYDNYNAEQAIAKAITDKQEQEDAAAAKQKLEDEQKQKEETTRKAEATRKEQEKNEQAALEVDNDKEIAATDVAKSNTDKVVADIAVTDNSSAKTEKDASEVVNTEGNANDNKNADNKTISEQAHALSNNHIKDINNKASAAINLVLKDAKLDATHQQLIRELETQVDDYLSEQMMLMSENLKSWLRAEMTQHFSEQNTSATTENAAKKNIH
ncbi:hypothetical protein [Psychrobacter sp. Pi2-1]|uniref:hypothetical protein n=1 Tax=Psychrobacter sp. Pi2-1 TaxID=2774131 RepID=UPI00191A79C5|nr:hypothetical protein [Psychrobacter sp. Pi2-1]